MEKHIMKRYTDALTVYPKVHIYVYWNKTAQEIE
jgi:hypothetical protein